MTEHITAHGKCSICREDLLWDEPCIETWAPFMNAPMVGQLTFRRSFAHADHFTKPGSGDPS